MFHAIRHRRSGLSLVELLLVTAILAVLIGLLIPAIQKAREAAQRTQCSNNMRQLGIATLSYANTYSDQLPPSTGRVTTDASPKAFGPVSHNFLLFPYLEQANLYNAAIAPPKDAPNSGAIQTADGIFGNQPLSVFLCPADTSTMGGLTDYTNPNNNVTYAACNYAHNLNVYTTKNPKDAKGPKGKPLLPVNFNKAAYTLVNIPDGSSNTISFAERIGICGERPLLAGEVATLPDGNDDAPRHVGGRSTRDLPTRGRQPGPLQRFTSSFGSHILNAGKAQNQPLPEFGVTRDSCEGDRPSSAHRDLMVIGMVDGSVRMAHSGIARETWWQLIHPADGEPIPDW